MAVTDAVVRPMRREDAPAVLALAGRLRAWFNEEGLRRMTIDVEPHEGFVATAAGRIVGFATWNRLDDETANLSWMGVEEALQHRGIGTSLLEALVTDLRRRAFRLLEVSTVADSVAYGPYAETRRFYRARGFVDNRVDKDFFGSGSDRYDRLVLRLDLSDPASTPPRSPRRPRPA